MSKSYRTITVSGVQYKWKVGRRFIDIRSPEGFRMSPTIGRVTGEQDIERARHKGYLRVVPQQVKEFIEAVNNVE